MIWQYSDGDTPNGGVECRGYKNAIFDQYLYLFISEMVQNRAMLAMADQ